MPADITDQCMELLSVYGASISRWSRLCIMGDWGHGIFQVDAAVDAKEDTLAGLADGLDGDAVFAHIKKNWGDRFRDRQEAEQAILGIAATLHKTGFLTPAVQDAALRIIDRAKSIPKARSSALAKLRDQLTGPQPVAKRPRKRPPYIAPFEPGDLVCFTLEDGRAAVVYVTGLHRGKRGDVSQYLRILHSDDGRRRSMEDYAGDLTPYINPNVPESPLRYFMVVDTKVPTNATVVGSIRPVPDESPVNIREMVRDLEQRGLKRHDPPEDGRATGGIATDWKRFCGYLQEFLDAQG